MCVLPHYRGVEVGTVVVEHDISPLRCLRMVFYLPVFERNRDEPETEKKDVFVIGCEQKYMMCSCALCVAGYTTIYHSCDIKCRLNIVVVLRKYCFNK